MFADYIPLATAFIGTTVAAIWDLKTTEVPEQLMYIMIAIALIFYGYQSFAEWNVWPIARSLVYGLGFLGFGAFMYYVGQWGGADSLILASMGFLLPISPPGFAENMMQFPLSYMTNMFIVGAAYMLLYALVLSLINRKILSGFLSDIGGNLKMIVKGSAGLFVLFYSSALFITGVSGALLDFSRAFEIAAIPFLSLAVLYVVWRFVKAVEKYGFRRSIHISKLKVGDMLLDEKKLIGITEEQLKQLKRSGKKYVDIKDGVRFAPAFPLALIVTLFYGDLILFLIKLI